MFRFQDVGYQAHNENQMTDAAATQLARVCPKLRVVKLQGAQSSRLTDASLIGFLSNCPYLSSLEISGLRDQGIVKDSSFDALRENPTWAPKLKTLRIPRCGDGTYKGRTSYMKAMRALTREREKLVVELVNVSQRKKWGDWELEESHERYRKG
ncbi:antagonist of mitotic exit network domain protein [Ophiocordyceps camponoti-floridani]|uniref:Antagonist of mitotic exit network domain protein n=1 Tax=Ophiocordyceps camponoti-floridani TaxID=2030778 RepID=A0A8H4Q102_9HYPO|nr:antagonist of mitotic exit network domain protein [Ophiocordyceps camponoti-floridani]